MSVHSRVLKSLASLALLCGTPALAQDALRVVHVFVALADNAHQGIVPVPARLGNGDHPERNLYWGAGYGVKTFFARSAEWRLETSQLRPEPAVLERCVFRHRMKNVLLIADAYQGRRIQQAIVDFLEAAAGESERGPRPEPAARNRAGPITIADKSGLVVYVGHEGLMDFSLPTLPHKKKDTPAREAIVLACVSRSYFAESLRTAGA